MTNNNLYLYELDQFNEEYSSLFEKMANEKDLIDIKPNKTAAALFALIHSVNMIKHGMVDVLKVDNIYAFKILHRSYLEHYIKTLFILIKHSEDFSDKIGEEYFQYVSINETLNKFKKGIKLAKFNSIIIDKKSYDMLIELFPAASQFSLNDINEINKKFTFDEMIGVIYKSKLIQAKEMDLLKGFIDDAMLYYPDLSSYVHGGPGVFDELCNLPDIETFDNEYKLVVKSCYLAELSLRQFFLLFLNKHVPKFKNELFGIQNYVNKIFDIIEK